jgi:ubiquitin-small subunit ribosomal protein S27Ae
MAKPKGGPKGKKEKAKKEGKKLSALYEISGDEIKRKNRTCPKCGPGMFLGKHKDRIVCGKCQYVEYMGKKSEEVSEEKKEEAKE